MRRAGWWAGLGLGVAAGAWVGWVFLLLSSFMAGKRNGVGVPVPAVVVVVGEWLGDGEERERSGGRRVC